MLCPNCFEENFIDSCKICSYTKTKEDSIFFLKQQTLLNNRYIVGKILGKGGFGVTYKCLDTTFGRKVAIKEYLPSSIATRMPDSSNVIVQVEDYTEVYKKHMSNFFDEAKLLASYSHIDGIVSVIDFFYANNTAYMVMEFLDGVTLKDYIDTKGTLNFNDSIALLTHVINSLGIMHQNRLLHRDISPDNIILAYGKSVLIDFGASRYAMSNESKALSIILKPGFAPLEQYSGSNQGPWTDVYAFASTLYYMITGKKPPDSIYRINEETLEPPTSLVPSTAITKMQEAVLLKAMAIHHQNRYRSIVDFINEVNTVTNQRFQQTLTFYADANITNLVNNDTLYYKTENPSQSKNNTSKSQKIEDYKNIYTPNHQSSFNNSRNNNNQNAYNNYNYNTIKKYRWISIFAYIVLFAFVAFMSTNGYKYIFKKYTPISNSIPKTTKQINSEDNSIDDQVSDAIDSLNKLVSGDEGEKSKNDNAKENKEYGVGEKLILNGVEYTANALYEVSDRNSKYAVVNFTVENKSNKTIFLNKNNFTMYFSDNTSETFAPIQSINGEFTCYIAPGALFNGEIAYQLSDSPCTKVAYTELITNKVYYFTMQNLPKSYTPKTKSFGEKFLPGKIEFDKYTFSITSLTPVTNYDFGLDSSSHIYYKAEFSIENKSDKALNLALVYFYLIDSKYRYYEKSMFSVSGDKNLYSGTVNPNSITKGSLLFEAPKNEKFSLCVNPDSFSKVVAKILDLY